MEEIIAPGLLFNEEDINSLTGAHGCCFRLPTVEAGALEGLWPTKPLSKGSWDGHHGVWGKLVLVLLFPGSSRQSRPARPLGQEREASEVMLAPLYVISRPSIPPAHPLFTLLPFPSSGFLKSGLKLQRASTGPSLSFPPFLLSSLEGHEMLVCEGDLHPIPHLPQATLPCMAVHPMAESRALGRACMPSHHSCFSKTKQK